MHAYPHTSPSAIPKLDRTLKGLYMVVYQALKCLIDSTQVAAVLDGSRYEEDSHKHRYSESPASDNDVKQTSKSYLTEYLIPTQFQDEYEDDY